MNVLNKLHSDEPLVTKELIEHLENNFSLMRVLDSFTTEAELHRIQGQHQVIDQLKAMYARQNSQQE